MPIDWFSMFISIMLRRRICGSIWLPPRILWAEKTSREKGEKPGEDDDDAVYLKEHMKCFSIM